MTVSIYIIIGTSAAGIAAVKKIRDLDKQGTIICISDEKENPYNKCFLADYLANHKADAQVYTTAAHFFTDNNIILKLNTRVTAIDRGNKKVVCSDGIVLTYTHLLLAVGARARRIANVQQNLKDLFGFYTLADALALKETVMQSQPEHIVVIGGGLTGVEIADALTHYNLKITLIEQGSRILGRQADEKASQLILEAATLAGVTVLTGVWVKEFCTTGEGSISGLLLSDGTKIETSVVISALGSQACLELAESAGLAIAQGGIVTDDFLQTSDPHIWAAGDVAIVNNLVTRERVRTATWPDSVQQGSYAAYSMVGQPRVYPGVTAIAVSAFFGQSFHSAGFLAPQDVTWHMQQKYEDGYLKVVFDRDNIVKGYLFFGKPFLGLSGYKRSFLAQTPLG